MTPLVLHPHIFENLPNNAYVTTFDAKIQTDEDIVDFFLFAHYRLEWSIVFRLQSSLIASKYRADRLSSNLCRNFNLNLACQLLMWIEKKLRSCRCSVNIWLLHSFFRLIPTDLLTHPFIRAVVLDYSNAMKRSYVFRMSISNRRLYTSGSIKRN